MVEISKEELWRMFWMPRLLKLWPQVALFVALVVIGATGTEPFGRFLHAVALIGWFAWFAEGILCLLGDPLEIAIDLEHQIIPFTARDSGPTSSPDRPASPPRPDPA
jgi:hypothetical protein